VSIKNDGHYFCRAGGNRPDGLNEPVTYHAQTCGLFFMEQFVLSTQKKYFRACRADECVD
ncbi:hypothetical protein AB7X83_23730, partial [Escherichia coli]